MTHTNYTTNVLHWFREISQIPRESGNEQGISDFLIQFAKDRGLEAEQDEELNVIIRANATAGYENHPSIILQGHIDMVAEKSDTSTHDFSKDPIELIEEGEWLHANETTLGADNGIAVAMALAVLDDPTIPHGPLECLFTTNEETGMNGAMAVKGDRLHGQYLLNIDTEQEHEFIVACAGGCRLDLTLPTNAVPTPAGLTALKVSVDGLHGGHSGIEIGEQLGNAVTILARLLVEAQQESPISLSHFTGGSKHNAIPRFAEATILCQPSDADALQAHIQGNAEIIRHELSPQDPNLQVKVTPCDTPATIYSDAQAHTFLQFLYLAPHGVFGVSKKLEGLVDTSNNIAIVEDNDTQLDILISVRSLTMSQLAYLRDRIMTLAKAHGFTASEQGRYPAWEYERGSRLEEQAIALYKEVIGVEPHVTAVHAGLECGLLKAQLPNTQMISFGPTILGAHTPKERLHLPAVDTVSKFLLTLLEKLQ